MEVSLPDGRTAQCWLGTSTRHASTHASVADDAVSVLDRLGVEEVATLGMSVGGAYAVTLAARHPDRVTALGVVAVLPQQDARLAAAAGPPAVAASVREALADHDGYLRDAALLSRPWPTRAEDVRCPTRLWYGELDARALPGGAWWAARVPGAALEVRRGATHWATLGAHWTSTLRDLVDP